MNMKRVRGLRQLVEDVVEHGSRAVERIQKETAQRPFAILEAMPTIGEPARLVHAVYDAWVGGVHGTIRVVNRAVGATVDAALVALDDAPSGDGDS